MTTLLDIDRLRPYRRPATQAEDRALVGTNPSAVLGAKTERGGWLRHPPPFHLGIGIKRQIPGGLGDSVPQIQKHQKAPCSRVGSPPHPFLSSGFLDLG